jgi:phosphoglycerate dehydrogenase-like enzyme
MLVLGLGGAGVEIARRAHAFGMRVRALDDKKRERPDFVFSLEKLDKLLERLSEADVVALALPLTEKTRGVIGMKQLTMMKDAYLVNAASTGLLDLKEIGHAYAAFRGAFTGGKWAFWRDRRIALDTTDVGSLPRDHWLRSLPKAVLTAYEGPPSREARERQWRLYRENVRRFVAGEALLCVVEPIPGGKR